VSRWWRGRKAGRAGARIREASSCRQHHPKSQSKPFGWGKLRTHAKINLAIDLAKQISNVAVDAGDLDRSDFEDALLATVDRMTE
jgi:hypothetical protein